MVISELELCFRTLLRFTSLYGTLIALYSKRSDTHIIYNTVVQKHYRNHLAILPLGVLIKLPSAYF
jgi:hypothetical protein